MKALTLATISLAALAALIPLNDSVAKHYYQYAPLFNSPGGRLDRFYAVRREFIKHRYPIRLGNCASACTSFLSLTTACVEPWGTFTFHGARSIVTHQIDPIASYDLWLKLPPIVRGLLQPLNEIDQVLRGETLIRAGMRACPD